MRNRRVVKMSHEDVVSIDATLAGTERDPLTGSGSVRFVSSQWVWKDGVPVSGSTPKRVAQRLAELEVDEFVDGEVSPEALGMDPPRARVVLKDAAEGARIVRIGSTGPDYQDSDGQPHQRHYAQLEGEAPVYLVHSGVLDVIRDLVRESGRKDKKDSEKAARHERIESAEAAQ
jgi:hypothetical protein